jgi:hypothetical protein
VGFASQNEQFENIARIMPQEIHWVTERARGVENFYEHVQQPFRLTQPVMKRR